MAQLFKISQQEVKFLWTTNAIYGKNNYLLQKNINACGRKFNENNIIGCSIEEKEKVFTQQFIDDYHFDEKCNFENIHTTLSTIQQQMKKKTILSPCARLDFVLNELNFQDYREKSEIIFGQIDFLPELKKRFKLGERFAKLYFKNFIVIHIRSGDALYGYAKFRTLASMITFQTISFEIVLEIIKIEKDKTIILVGDDIDSIEKFVQEIKLFNVFSIHSIRDINLLSNLESVFFDVGFMSAANKIYGTFASLVTLATLSNASLEHINPYNYFSIGKLSEILNTNREKLYFLNNYYKAHSLFCSFIYDSKLKYDKNKLLVKLRKALKYDHTNDKYRIYILDLLLKNKQFELANRYLYIILKNIHNRFIDLLLVKFPDFLFIDNFSVYKKSYSSYPFIYYVSCRIYFANNQIYDGLKITSFLLKLNCMYFLKDILNILYYTYSDDFFHISQNSAKSRIQNQLSYKLGQAMIINSKSLFGYIKMPFVLSYIKDKHNQEQKIYKEKIKKDPSLKLPSLENYPDYKEALKEKECLTYKLGQALIQADKEWYKGGYIKLWFEVRKLKREFNNKRNT
ncbi:hypothetical protein [Campylobacter volucris]|uniref:hypothetical protein n=1 Tax=Campylobacter volucris TaxID=1031542 RepID=UPI001E2DFC79|nr:hypothetical protein [Campylobacter volucris]